MISISKEFTENKKSPIVYGVYDGFPSSNNLVEVITYQFGKVEEETRIIHLAEEYLNRKLGKIHILYPYGGLTRKVYLVGLGDKSWILNKDYVRVFISLIKELKKQNESEVCIDLDSFGVPLEITFNVVYGLIYGSYTYDECKSEQTDYELDIQFIAKDSRGLLQIIENALVLATAVNNSRDLINKPYNYLKATDLAHYCEKLVKELDNDKVTIEVFTKSQIIDRKMGAFLSVNKGSTEEPRLIHMKYKGDPSKEGYLGLVGKGVMFDTGGYTLKSSMITMKCDMAGAASVIGVFEAIVKGGFLCNINVVIAATDNRISGDALLPDDVITAANGKTIEIVSTDAEGRLTLADALWFAQKNGATEVIDIATLTGACVNALGEYTSGLFTNNRKMIKDFMDIAKANYEDVWELPITDYNRTKIRGSKVADLFNSVKAPMGASNAAAFLEEFVNKSTKWLHIDIAGTAYHTSPNEYEDYGATGAMIRTMYMYAKAR